MNDGRALDKANAADPSCPAITSELPGDAEWLSFWDGDHALYVSARHRQLHDALVTADMIAFIRDPAARVLDYGCGEIEQAGALAAACSRLFLFDASQTVRAKLRQRFGRSAGIEVLDEAALRNLQEESLDIVFCNSVLQYVSASTLDDLLQLWRGKLKPGGLLVIADVIPRTATVASDVAALLAFARRGGFLAAACQGLVITYFSRYRRLRTEVGLSTYTAEEFAAVLTRAGFAPTRAERNIGHNQARMTFIATPLAVPRTVEMIAR